MKKIILLFVVFLCAVGTFAQNNSLNNQVERAVATAANLSAVKASVTFSWEKPVRISDVMCRRPRCEDVVIRWDHATTTCTGTFSDENKVYFVANCLEPSSFELEHLKEVKVTLSNGVEVFGGKNTVGRYNDIAWINISPNATRGLAGLAVYHTRKGSSLQDAHGSSMTQKLKQYFQSKHIPARSRSCRIGYVPHTSKMSVGDPVVIDGKLMALVKNVPTSYEGFFGGVSENSLAVIH
ncbi:MAG: hypothetical protein IJ876_01630 [Elusimicrobiaceae bacterium]|nr:hypothetical protein [Elusimicrobiaceae bacterium]